MKPKEPVKTDQHDMFRLRLDQIIDMGHEKVVLAGAIDWQYLSDKCELNYTDWTSHVSKTLINGSNPAHAKDRRIPAGGIEGLVERYMNQNRSSIRSFFLFIVPAWRVFSFMFRITKI